MAGFLREVACGPLVGGARTPDHGRVTSTPTRVPRQRRTRLHPAWFVAAVAFLAVIGAAGFRSTPGVMLTPLHQEFGWSVGTISAAVSVNLVLYGLTSPFATALMERFGPRKVVAAALATVAVGSGATVFMTAPWQLILCWGVLVGLGTGSMALGFAALVTDRWFVARRGLIIGILTAAGATGQLVFLPLLSTLISTSGWRSAALVVAAIALLAAPLVWWRLRDRPEDIGVLPYGATEAPAKVAQVVGGGAMRAVTALGRAARKPVFWLLAASFAICGATTNGLVQIHFIPAAHDHGMVETTSAGLLAMVGVFDIVGTVLSGWLTDRFDSRLLLIVYYTGPAAACRCSCCPACSPPPCVPTWSSSSCSTAWTGSLPCRRRWRCAAVSSAPTDRSFSLGCWHRTRWVPASRQ